MVSWKGLASNVSRRAVASWFHCPLWPGTSSIWRWMVFMAFVRNLEVNGVRDECTVRSPAFACRVVSTIFRRDGYFDWLLFDHFLLLWYFLIFSHTEPWQWCHLRMGVVQDWRWPLAPGQPWHADHWIAPSPWRSWEKMPSTNTTQWTPSSLDESQAATTKFWRLHWRELLQYLENWGKREVRTGTRTSWIEDWGSRLGTRTCAYLSLASILYKYWRCLTLLHYIIDSYIDIYIYIYGTLPCGKCIKNTLFFHKFQSVNKAPQIPITTKKGRRLGGWYHINIYWYVHIM